MTVEFEPPPDGDAAAQCFDFKHDLGKLLSRPVDLVELNAVENTRLKRVIETTKVSIYVAQAEEVAQVSGHSIRVGATQDLLGPNIDLASVTQAGRWKTNRMPMRYAEHVLTARGGMARAAMKQRR